MSIYILKVKYTLSIIFMGLLLVVNTSCSNTNLHADRTAQDNLNNDILIKVDKTQIELESLSMVKKLEQTNFRVPLDILLVIDNSTSMKAYQENLSTQLQALISALDEDTDWRIVATSTTPEAVKDPNLTPKTCILTKNDGSPIMIEAKDYRDPKKRESVRETYRALISMDDKDRVGYEEGLYKILEALNLVNKETFAKVKKADPTYNVEEADFKEQTPCPVWRRPDTKLVILILSDEDHCSFNHYATFSTACTIVDPTPISDHQVNAKLMTSTDPYKNLLEDDLFPGFDTYQSNLPPREQRCILRVDEGDSYSFFYGKTQCRQYDSSFIDPEKPTSYTVGMTDRTNSSRIFMNYLLQSVGKKKNVKIYGILNTNPDVHKLGFSDSYVYQKVVEETGGISKDIHTGNSSSDAYKSLLEEISSNIHASMIEHLGLSHIPERVNTITLGALDEEGNFIPKKVLKEEEYSVINGNISFTEIDSVGEFTHAKIDYYTVKTIE